MLRITVSRSAEAARDYFRESLRRADYYLDGEETNAVWHGKAADLLGLKGKPVDDKTFLRLLAGQHPLTGEKLTARMRANRRPGFDFTYSVPKAVSLAYAIGGDERIIVALDRAVASAMARVEQDIKTRVRIGGKNEDRVAGNLMYAPFVHKTARPIDGVPDPQLHVHAYCPNLVFDPDEKRWKAAQIGDVKADGAYYEAVFLNELARQMRGLGYKLNRRGKWWSIDGFNRKLIDRFSRRTDQVEQAAEELGIRSDAAKDGLGASTRAEKDGNHSFEQLQEIWRASLSVEEREMFSRVIDGLKEGRARQVSVGAAQAALEFAIGKIFAKRSVVKERDLVAEALNSSMGTASLEDLLDAVQAQGLLRADVDGKPMVTTQALLDEERQMLDWARNSRATMRKLNPNWRLRDTRLNRGQQSAVTHLLNSRDRVILLLGGAGTGKTRLMTEAITAMVGGGTGVHVLAPTVDAVNVLKSEGLKRACTLQSLLQGNELVDARRGDVVWVDEAGLISVPQMNELFKLAQENGLRVIVSGDPRQHKSVERGDAFRLLEERAGLPFAEVTEIMRQRGAYKRVVESLKRGNINQGWDQLEAMGAVFEVPFDQKPIRLAEDYLTERKAGRELLIVAPTHAEKDAVTRVIRSRLMDEGELKGKMNRTISVLRNLHMETVEKAEADRYRAGLVIKVRKNARGLVQGQLLTVAAHDKDGQVIACDLTGKRHILPLDQADRFTVFAREDREFAPGDLIRITDNQVLPDGRKLANGNIYKLERFASNGDLLLSEGVRLPVDFGHLDYGYAATSYGAQGRTLDVVLVSLGSESEMAISQELFYVAISRGRYRAGIYTNDKDAVSEATKRSSERKGAVELGEAGISLKGYTHALERLAYKTAQERVGPQDLDRQVLAQISAAAIVHDGRIADGPERGRG